jgi:aminoglycoside 3-N-acetyltransferase I
METIEIKRLEGGNEALAADVVRVFKSERASAEHMRRFLANGANVLFVASMDGGPVGFLLAHKLERLDSKLSSVLIYELEVAEEHRRKGVATGMIQALQRTCAMDRSGDMWLISDENDAAALALYRSTGAARREGASVLLDYRLDP